MRNGALWFWGLDILSLDGGAEIAAPTPMRMPPGVTFTKVVTIETNEYAMLALASDHTVWKYGSGGVPIQIPLPGPARDITSVGFAAFVVETNNDLLAWGYLGGYLGAPNLGTTPVSIKGHWVDAGVVFPSKELVGNSNTLHIIDQNDNLFGAGDNVMGEIGNGVEWNPWRTYTGGGTLAPFAWNWGHSQLLSPVVRIPGKFKNLQSDTTYTCYLYVQDFGGNWYSWGRNKANALGNGRFRNSNDQSLYPNWEDVPAPTLVTPLTPNWVLVGGGGPFGPSTFDVNAQLPPMANAGINQWINTSSTTLYGSGSSQQEGALTYQWAHVSGPNVPTIVDPTAVNTSVTGMNVGTHVFRLTVTNNHSVSASRDVSVTRQ